MIYPVSTISTSVAQNQPLENQPAHQEFKRITKQDCRENPHLVGVLITKAILQTPDWSKFESQPIHIGSTTWNGQEIQIYKYGYSRLLEGEELNSFKEKYPEGITKLQAEEELQNYFVYFAEQAPNLEHMNFFFNLPPEGQIAIAAFDQESKGILSNAFQKMIGYLSADKPDYESAIRELWDSKFAKRDPEHTKALEKTLNQLKDKNLL